VVDIGYVKMVQMTSHSKWPILYLVAALFGLLVAAFFSQLVPFAALYGLAGLARLCSLLLPSSARPWPLVIATLPLIPASLLYALFLFPFHLPIVALLVFASLRSFNRSNETVTA
jgi:hypothetical protein